MTPSSPIDITIHPRRHLDTRRRKEYICVWRALFLPDVELLFRESVAISSNGIVPIGIGCSFCPFPLLPILPHKFLDTNSCVRSRPPVSCHFGIVTLMIRYSLGTIRNSPSSLSHWDFRITRISEPTTEVDL